MSLIWKKLHSEEADAETEAPAGLGGFFYEQEGDGVLDLYETEDGCLYLQESSTEINPGQIPGLFLWMDPAQEVNHTTNKINSWRYQSSFSHLASKVTDDSRPTWVSSDADANNEPIVQNDSSVAPSGSKFLVIPHNSTLQPTEAFDFYAVVSNTSLPVGPATPQGWFGKGRYTGAATLSGYHLFYDGAAGSRRIKFGVYQGASVYKEVTSNVINLTSNRFYMVRASWDGSNTKLYLHGVLEGTNATVSGPIDYTSDDLDFYLGTSLGMDPPRGETAEIALFNRVLTAREAAGLEIYFISKYALTAP